MEHQNLVEIQEEQQNQVLVDVYAKAKVELTYVHAFDAIFDGFSQPANGMVVPVMPQEPRKNVE